MVMNEPTRFERLYQQTGWTMRQMAQAVNRLGTECGIPLRYREPSVHQWRGGALPRDVVRPLVLEVLSRRLDRPVTDLEAGFPVACTQLASTVEGLLDLGSCDMDPSRRGVMGAATAFSVAMATPAWADVAGRMEAVQSGRRIGMPDVDMVTRMTDRLAKLDGEFGGRRVRPMASSFLVNTVVPCLRAEAPSDVRSAMLSAAAFLSYLTGWMAVDEGAHGLAQRYYTKGLELAGAAGDHSTYCHILRGMSVQAAGLGHGPSAVRLANAATASAPITGPRMVAFMAGQQAHAYAVAGDKTAAFGSLRETEKALDQASTTTTFGGFSASTLAYLSAQVRYSLGDVPGSIRSLEEHFRVRDDGDSHRSFLRFSALLAERRLEVGHLESACATWNAVLDDYPTMQSGQVDRHVQQIAVRLRPYRSNAVARATYERAASAA